MYELWFNHLDPITKVSHDAVSLTYVINTQNMLNTVHHSEQQMRHVTHYIHLRTH